jgi:hypothetical protein
MTLRLPPLAEIRKTLVAVVSLGCVAAAIILGHINPNFSHAAILLTGSIVSLLGVFLSKNHTEEDLSKMVLHVVGLGFTCVEFWTKVSMTTVTNVTLAIGALVSLYAVWRVPNANPKFAVPVPPAPPQKA